MAAMGRMDAILAVQRIAKLGVLNPSSDFNTIPRSAEAETPVIGHHLLAYYPVLAAKYYNATRHTWALFGADPSRRSLIFPSSAS